jgi:hypothetical protein
MSNEPRLVFLNSQTLGQRGSLEAILAAISSAGYELFDLRVGSRQDLLAHWDRYDLQAERELKAA